MVSADEFREQRDAITDGIAKRIRSLREDLGSKAVIEYAFEDMGSRHFYRGILGLEVYRALGGVESDFLDSAVGLESLHEGTVVLDDSSYFDNALSRRGRPSVHAKYGQSYAVLAAFNLIPLGQGLILLNANSHKGDNRMMDGVLSKVNDVLQGITRGQELDGERGKSDKQTLASAYEKNRLFELACMLPGIFLECNPDIFVNLERFGGALSLGHQLVDDRTDQDGAYLRFGMEELNRKISKELRTAREKARAITGEDDSRLERLVQLIFGSNEPARI